MNRRINQSPSITTHCLSAVLIAACLAGCGGTDGPPRVPVEGAVTFQGQPIEKGSILFIPTNDTTGPSTGGTIESGRYELEHERGPVIGTLRVEIRADREFGYDITEPTESVKHIGEPFPENEIPTEYNDESVLTVTTTESGDNRFDFHLPTSE